MTQAESINNRRIKSQMALDPQNVFAKFDKSNADLPDGSLQSQIDELDQRVSALEQESKLPSDGSGGGIRNPNAESLGGGISAGKRR
jgi:hypothetical protein